MYRHMASEYLFHILISSAVTGFSYGCFSLRRSQAARRNVCSMDLLSRPSNTVMIRGWCQTLWHSRTNGLDTPTITNWGWLSVVGMKETKTKTQLMARQFRY